MDLITFEEFKKMSVEDMFDYLYEHYFLEEIENDYFFTQTKSYDFNEHVNGCLTQNSDGWEELADILHDLKRVNDSYDWVYLEWQYDSWCDFHELSSESLANIVSEYSNDENYPFKEPGYKTDCSGLVNLI